MKKSYLWTKLKARLQFISVNSEASYNWIFLPSAGLGSEYLSTLTKDLNLPGTTWHLDFPGDGSNLTTDDAKYFAHWSESLLEAVSALKNVILVAHSSGGMLALATPALEKLLSGLILISSAPNQSWQKNFQQYVKKHPLPKVIEKENIYIKHPSNKTLKEYVFAGAPYCSIENGLKRLLALYNSMTFNCAVSEWCTKHFYSTYEAKWIPKTIPTLIFSGDKDRITPLKLFSESKKFIHKNILLQEIKNAGHFPWIDNPRQTKALFKKYCQLFLL